VIVVDHGGTTNVACAEEFSQWIRSGPVQQTIAHFGVEKYGQPLFFPDAPS
jgi:ABC-type tungstate transport system permease subunit